MPKVTGSSKKKKKLSASNTAVNLLSRIDKAPPQTTSFNMLQSRLGLLLEMATLSPFLDETHWRRLRRFQMGLCPSITKKLQLHWILMTCHHLFLLLRCMHHLRSHKCHIEPFTCTVCQSVCSTYGSRSTGYFRKCMLEIKTACKCPRACTLRHTLC